MGGVLEYTGRDGGTREVSKDKAEMFAAYWRMFGDGEPPEAEYRFDPVRKWRLDWAWPAVKVCVEVDGGQWAKFGGRHMRDSDREKQNALARAGWVVFHFSPEMLEYDPRSCVMQVAETIWERMLV